MTSTTTPSTPGSSVPATTPPPGQVIPFPLPWGGGGNLPWLPPGCCPPGGMDALMKCYCDIQAASAFIATIMIDQINNNPAVVQAIIAAIEKSGSNLPLIGVTNGTAAQPGQVGEWILFQAHAAYPATFVAPIPVTMGSLPPGDWDLYSYVQMSSFINDVIWQYLPVPPGWSDAGQTTVADQGANLSLRTPGVPVQALTSVPSLVAMQLQVNTLGPGSSAGTATIYVACRRRR